MKRFFASNCTIINNEIFLVGIVSAGLLAKLDLDNGKVDYCDIMDGFRVLKKGTIIDFIDHFFNRIYALDSERHTLIVWDFIKLKCEYISLNCKHKLGTNFVAFERYGQDYYIFPKYENKILILHTVENKITEITNYLDGVDEVQCACRVDDEVWLLPKDTNVIYCYNLQSASKEKYDLKKVIKDCVHAIFRDGYIYILNMDGVIYKWDIEKQELQEITLMRTDPKQKATMSKIIFAGNRIILLPAYGKDIKILDRLTGQAEIYKDYPNDYYDETEWLKYYGYCEDESFYYFATCSGNYMLEIEKQSGELIWIKPQIDSLGRKTINYYSERVMYEANWEPKDLIGINSSSNKFSPIKTYNGKEIYNRVGRYAE